MGKIIRGTFLNPLSHDQIQILPSGFMRIDDDGRIESISSQHLPGKGGNYEFIDFENLLIIPGLIDTHTHLSQFGFAGIGNLPLLPWLNKYTFPEEMKYRDTELAYRRALSFFQRCLNLGTTTVVAYITAHVEATHAAFGAAEKTGIRAFLGQVLMDRNAPPELCVSAKSALPQVEALIKTWHQKNDRLHFVSTPRFAISCTAELLVLAGDLARNYDLPLQTHISENLDEISETLKLYPGNKDYLEVYERYGCIGEFSLLGHGIHLTLGEQHRIKDAGASVVHCPTSNRFLGSGALPYREMVNRGVKIALGTDVAAGYDLSMLHEAREAIETSKTHNMILTALGRPVENAMSIAEALYLSTLGGAIALRKENSLGNFAEGKWADFVVLDDLHALPFKEEVSEHDSAIERLSRVLYRPFGGTVHSTWVGGKSIYNSKGAST